MNIQQQKERVPITISEIVENYPISKTTINRLVKMKKLKAYRPFGGTKIVFDKAEFEAGFYQTSEDKRE